MAAISSLLSPNLLHYHTKSLTVQSQPLKLFTSTLKLSNFQISSHNFASSPLVLNPRELTRVYAAVAEEAQAPTQDPSSVAARKLYIGNIPRKLGNAELTRIVEEHGAVEKAEVMYDKYSGRSRRFAFVTMKTVEDANTVVEKLNGTKIEEREIKVNITEKPLTTVDLSLIQAEESQFIDGPHKVYVGNLGKAVTTEKLSKFFSDKCKVLSAKVSRVQGTSKSSGFGFVTFSSEEDVEAAISSFNNTLLDGQKVRVNKA